MKHTASRLKKLLLAVVAMMLLAALTVPAFAVGQSSTLAKNGNQYVVNVKGLNVRSGPGMGYSVLGVAR